MYEEKGHTWKIFWRHMIGFVDDMGCHKMVEIKYEIEVFGLIHQELGQLTEEGEVWEDPVCSGGWRLILDVLTLRC